MKKSFRDTKSSGFKDSRKSGGGNFWERGSARSGSTTASMHKATCSDCGKQCEVPFKPTGNRPIFCSMCFQKDGNTNPKRSNGISSGRSSSNKYGDRNTDNVSEQLRIVNAKLDAILKALR